MNSSCATCHLALYLVSSSILYLEMQKNCNFSYYPRRVLGYSYTYIFTNTFKCVWRLSCCDLHYSQLHLLLYALNYSLIYSLPYSSVPLLLPSCMLSFFHQQLLDNSHVLFGDNKYFSQFTRKLRIYGDSYLSARSVFALLASN